MVVMRKMAINRKSQKHGPRVLANRDYKQKIYALCERTKNGDKGADLELAAELNNNTLAIWAVKHWNKLQKSSGRKKQGPKKAGKGLLPTLATAKTPLYGNAYKPYQGGAPGLGKKS